MLQRAPCGRLISLLLVCIVLCSGDWAVGSSETPVPEEPTGVVEKGGQFLPLDAIFTNELGDKVSLGQLIDKPTLLLPVYFNCPRICSFDMANLALALQQTKIDPDSFNIVTFSFNDQETPEDAANAKRNYTNMLRDDFTTDSWSFLTGDKKSIQQVTESIGYSYKDVGGGLFLHPSAMVAAGSDGKIIKYVYGAFLSGDVDLALSEAEKGTPTTSIKRFLAYCLTSSPDRNRKFFLILKGAILLIIGLGGFYLVRLLRKERDS
ncbi:MAG: protein SCO1/2 [Desulforhopalus sp.]|jgi:protein SCO1/2